MKSEGLIFCRHLSKICLRAPNFVGFVEEKNTNPLFENPPSLGGEGRGGEKWDVDKWIMNFPTMICQGLIAESELKQGLKSRVISKT